MENKCKRLSITRLVFAVLVVVSLLVGSYVGGVMMIAYAVHRGLDVSHSGECIRAEPKKLGDVSF